MCGSKGAAAAVVVVVAVSWMTPALGCAAPRFACLPCFVLVVRSGMPACRGQPAATAAVAWKEVHVTGAVVHLSQIAVPCPTPTPPLSGGKGLRAPNRYVMPCAG